MKPTREQLELAAKAAGIEGEIRQSSPDNYWFQPVGLKSPWRPHESKTDSFDLMVACLISPRFSWSGDSVIALTSRQVPPLRVDFTDYPTVGDAVMAAIFLCAVEIGRGL